MTTLTPAERTAILTDTSTLRHVVTALNSDLEAAMKLDVRPTQAHAGMLEMLQAFSRELSLRTPVSAK